MLLLALFFFLSSLATSLAITFLARRYARRLGLMDEPGKRKVHTTPTPRNGGIGIFAGIALPLLLAIILLSFPSVLNSVLSPQSSVLLYIPGMRHHIPLVLLLLAATFATHLLGLFDDHKSLPPWPKLITQLAIAVALVTTGELLEPGAFRILTALDASLSTAHLGFILSATLSILWITAVTNAFNFLDHMDGLAAGVAFCCGLMFLIAAALAGQWFICGLLALFLGSVLGFLFYNFPPATIFMGDGGSLVLGFFLSALTIRTTYLPPTDPTPRNHWYSLLAPIIILAVPLYDLTIVCLLRLLRGRSPMTGDTNHFSHRLARHGFSPRSAVLIIYAVTLASGLSAPLLTRADQFTALLITTQFLAILLIIAILERVGEHTS